MNEKAHFSFMAYMHTGVANISRFDNMCVDHCLLNFLSCKMIRLLHWASSNVTDSSRTEQKITVIIIYFTRYTAAVDFVPVWSHADNNSICVLQLYKPVET